MKRGRWMGERKTKKAEEILAVSVKPKIRIEILDNKEKSKLIRNMKTLIEKMTDDPDFDLSEVMAGIDKQLDLPFIPEEDTENPDLEVEDIEGPEISEEDSANNEKTSPLSLGELIDA